MSANLPTLITRYKFIQFKSVNGLPGDTGLFIIADCPLTKIDPSSSWECTPLKFGSCQNIKASIEALLSKDNLIKLHKNLNYFVLPNLPHQRTQDILEEIKNAYNWDK